MKYKECPECRNNKLNVERVFISISTYLNGKLITGPVNKGRLSTRTIVCEKCGFSEETSNKLDGEKQLSMEEFQQLFNDCPKQLKGKSSKKTSYDN